MDTNRYHKYFPLWRMSSTYFEFFYVMTRIDTDENVAMFERSPNFGLASIDLPCPAPTQLTCLTWLSMVLCLLALLLWLQCCCFPFSMSTSCKLFYVVFEWDFFKEYFFKRRRSPFLRNINSIGSSKSKISGVSSTILHHKFSQVT